MTTTPTPPAKGGRPTRTIASLLIADLIMLVLGPIVSTAITLGGVAENLCDSCSDPSVGQVGTVYAVGSSRIELSASEPVTCQVTDPDGRKLTTFQTAADKVEFRSTKDGKYPVECTKSVTVSSPDFNTGAEQADQRMAEAKSHGRILGWTVAGAGLMLLVAALVVWVRSVRRRPRPPVASP